MKRLLITASALALLTAPAMAQSSSKSLSASAAQAASRASGGMGFSGGNSFTNNFGGSKIPNNTPDVIVSPGSVSGSDCQLPGFALGGAIVGNGGALSIPGGTDEECKALTLASFYAKLSNSVTDPREARTYRQTSVALTCQVPRMRALPLCAAAVTTVVPISYPRAGAEPGHAASSASKPRSSERDAGGEGGRTVGSIPATGANYSYAQLQAQGWYCNEPDRVGYYPAVSVCSAWLAVKR